MTILLWQKPLTQVVRQIVQRDNGAWFDPSDMSTLYQDAAGTTTVTAVEQPVGKILDKSGNGYHATQSITASRPTLSARYNQLTDTDTFSGWTTRNTSIVSGLLTATSTNIDVSLRYPTTQLINTKYSTSIEAKQGTTKWLRLRNLAVNNNVNGEAWFDLSSGVLGTVLGSVSASIVDVGGGYFRCSITGSTISTINANYVDYAPSDADNTRSVTVGKTLYVRNPIHNIGDLFLPYQRVNTATDYDTDTRYFPKYLRFDGVDDYLSLPYMGLYAGGACSVISAIGTTIPSDSAYLLTEGSSSSNNPNYLFGRNTSSKITLSARNNASVVFESVTSNKALVNFKNVTSFTDTGSIGNIYFNSTQDVSTAYTRADPTSLNLTTIGVLNRVSPFGYYSGNLYSLIITKSALTDAQRVRCERYAASKAGVIL